MTKLFFVLLVSVSVLFPQNIIVDNNKDFQKALNFYNSNKLNDAISLFKKIAERTENNSKITASSFFISKILSEQKKYSEAEKYINNFLSDYPQSKFADDVKNLLIKNYVDKSDWNKAFESCLEFVETSNSISSKKETKQLAEKIALNNLNSFTIEQQIKKHSELESFLLLLSGKIFLVEGDNKKALEKFNELTSKHGSSDEYIEALNLKKVNNNLQSEGEYPVIGILLSLTDNNGREIESAKEILEGIKYAFHEYNSNRTDKVGIIVSDIKRDKTTISDAVSNFINNNKVRCIIGPIFSDDVRNALIDLDGSDLCLISPTATDDDLVSMSENFYQANPSLTSRGKIFAQYLYFVENKRKLAVINSIDGYSPLLAASFSKEFEKLDGKIIAKETFKSKSFDLTDQMNRISSISKSIEGLYAPIADGNDANAILSQMVQSGLNLDIYGNQDWFLGKGFESSPELSNKLTFDSDYFIDFNDSDFKEFSSSFKKTAGIEINRNILYGYDTAKYLLTVLRNIDPTRKNIKYKMESGINVTGFHNNISFDYDRTNKFINIVRFNDGVFELVDKFRAGK